MTASTIVFYLGGDRVGLWQAVAQHRVSGAVAIVSFATTLGDDADVEALSSDVTCHRAAEVVDDERVARSRELAWRWLDEVSMRTPTALGMTLSELVTDEDGRSLWSLADITLQESTYLAVRFVETLDAWVGRLHPNGVAVAGSDSALPWQRALIDAWARARGLQTYRLGTERAARERLPLPLKRPGPSAIFLDPRAPPAGIINVFVRIGEMLAAVVLAPLAALLVVLGATAASAMPTGLSGAWRSFMLVARIAVALSVFVAGVVLFVPLVLTFLVVSWIAIIRSDQPLRLGDIRIAIADLARMGSLGRAVLPTKRRLPGAATGRPASILAVEDEGNLRTGVSLLGAREKYNPYLEGVISAIRRTGRDTVVVARYGSRPGGRVSRLLRRVLRRVGLGGVHVVDFITPDLWTAAERWRTVNNETGRALLAKGIAEVFTYRGVSLAKALHGDISTLFSILHERVLYVHGFGRLLQQLDPAAVVAYNWEGVFRPLTRAAVAARVPIIGVQQALGPYGHALDHRSAGYTSSGEIGSAFPIPRRLLLWGELHAANLAAYGYPASTLAVTGYPRLDPFVRAQPAPGALRRRLRIERADARIVTFTAVLRVVGTGLVRERDYLDTFDALVGLAAADPRLHVVVKPWPGDDIPRVREIVKARGSAHVRFLPPDTELHNADLLVGSDALLGTFSSIVAEAIVADCTPIVMDYPECRYYFGTEHVAHYEGIAKFISTPAEVGSAGTHALTLPAAERRAQRDAALRMIEVIFGPADGRSAERIADEVVRVAHSADAALGAAPARR